MLSQRPANSNRDYRKRNAHACSRLCVFVWFGKEAPRSHPTVVTCGADVVVRTRRERILILEEEISSGVVNKKVVRTDRNHERCGVQHHPITGW